MNVVLQTATQKTYGSLMHVYAMNNLTAFTPAFAVRGHNKAI